MSASMPHDGAHRGGRSNLLLCACVAALAPGLAHAQASGSGIAIEEIVVTAQRREERLQDVPTAITAVTADQLSRSGVDDVKELGQVTPGLFVAQGNLSPQPTIRGIGARGNNPSDEGTVPIYIDGVYQPFSRAGFPQLNNIERVEVLKGPQGTLFGRNATGGAISIITKKPQVDPAGTLEASYGSRNAYRLKAYVTGGYKDVAADFSITKMDDDGYVTDILRKVKYGQRKSLDYRTKVLWTPNDVFEATIAYSFRNDSNNAALASGVLDGNVAARRTSPGTVIATAPYQASLSFTPIARNVQTTGSLTAVFHLDGFDITSISAVQKNKLSDLSDGDLVAANTNSLTFIQRSHTAEEELYAASTGEGRFQWVVGTFLFHDVSGYRPISRGGAVPTFTSAPTDSIAVYAQGSYDITDTVSLTVGGRYTKEWRRYAAVQGSAHAEGRTNFSKFTPNATLKYQPSDALNLYAKYSTGFKSGVYTTNALSTSTVRPENVKAYEIGIKSAPARNIRVNAAIYSTDYDDIQLTAKDAVTGASFLQNAAKSTLKGGEIEIIARLMEGLDIRLGASKIDAKFGSFIGAQVNSPIAGGGNNTSNIDASGKTMPKIPDVTANLGIDYARPLAGGEMRLSANVSHTGKFTWDSANRLYEDPVTVFNGEISWSAPGDHWRIALWGENLTDEVYHASITISADGDAQTFAPPRTYGVKLGYRWN